jgi:periplasmic protein CpxP/Spy
MPLTMNLPSLRLALLAGLALPFGLATASLAQSAPPPAPDATSARHQWRDHAPVDPAARRAHMAEHLTAVLQLQPSQQGALAAFLDSMKPPGDMKDRMGRGRGEDERLPTPQRLDKMLARFDEMHARMVVRAQATKQFYAQLSPSQQKAFDALAPMMMRRGGGERGMMGHRHDGDGPGRAMGDEMGPGGQSQG